MTNVGMSNVVMTYTVAPILHRAQNYLRDISRKKDRGSYKGRQIVTMISVLSRIQSLIR